MLPIILGTHDYYPLRPISIEFKYTIFTDRNNFNTTIKYNIVFQKNFIKHTTKISYVSRLGIGIGIGIGRYMQYYFYKYL